MGDALEAGDGDGSAGVHGPDAELNAFLLVRSEQHLHFAPGDHGADAVPLQPIEDLVLQREFLGGLQLGVEPHHLMYEAFLHVEQRPPVHVQ
jgi:hypothetical protein